MDPSPDPSPDPRPAFPLDRAPALDRIRSLVESADACLAVWDARDEPDADARRNASEAVAAIDAAVAGLQEVRAALITEVRAADDALLGPDRRAQLRREAPPW